MHLEPPGDPQRSENKKFIKILSEWSHFHLLIADDDEDDVEFFEKAFLELAPDFKISKVSGSEELIKQLEKLADLPDLIILDLNMPARNGFEALQEIRFNKRLSQIPVMIYSTTANPEQVNKTYELGANMYLQKPNNFSGIKSLIRTILAMDPDSYMPQPKRDAFLFKLA